MWGIGIFVLALTFNFQSFESKGLSGPERLLTFNSVRAQGIPVSIGGLELSASTDNPVPGQKVTITAKSYSTNINSAKISWTVAGKSVLSGTGATKLEVTAPALGKRLTVNASAITAEGRTLNSSIAINSGSVDMIIESDGYVPTSFRGKLSPVYQNLVTITAIPHLANSSGVEYDPKTLVYNWKKNSQVIQDQSGYGKQSITLAGDIVPRAYTLTVTVGTRDGSAQAVGMASVSFNEPSISFYVDDPLYGPLFNRTILDSLRIGSKNETSVLMVPFGYNKPFDSIGSLSLLWKINGVEHAELAENESIVLRAPEGSAGASAIELEIRNLRDILQGGSNGFNAIFSANSSSSTDSVTF